MRDKNSTTYLWAAGGAGLCALLGHAIDGRSGAAIGGAVGGLLGGLFGAINDDIAGR